MKRILVRSPNWIGDQILAFPFFHYLRKAYPKAYIAAACVPWVEEVQFRDMVDEVIVLRPSARPGFSEKFAALEEGARVVRSKGPWDLGISLPNSFSSAWLLYRGDARKRRGYRVDGRGILLNEGIRWAKASEEHRAQAYVDLLPESGLRKKAVTDFWGVLPENDLDPGVPGELPRFEFKKSWPEFDRIAPPKEPYWVLAPGSKAESRRWPIEYFIRLARQVSDETGWKGVIVGGVSEAVLADELCRDPSLKLIDRTAQGPVPVLAEIFSNAKFTVSNDSGLAHVASLCGSFVQVVWGAGDPKRTRPIGPGRVQVALNPVDCWPCERNTCDLAEEKLKCLRGIQTENVWEEIKRGLRLEQR